MGSLILPSKYHQDPDATQPDQALIPRLIELREAVDHANGSGVIDIMGKVRTVTHHGVVIGYWVKETRPRVYQKRVLIKFGQPVSEIPEAQKDPIVLACFDVFLQEGQGPVGIEIVGPNLESAVITQSFAPLMLTKTETAKTHIKINDDLDRILVESTGVRRN